MKHIERLFVGMVRIGAALAAVTAVAGVAILAVLLPMYVVPVLVLALAWHIGGPHY